MKPVCVVLCILLVAVAGNPVQQPQTEKLSLRRMLVQCLDSQADQPSSDDAGFTSCLADQLTSTGNVKLLPGVVLSSTPQEQGRAMGQDGALVAKSSAIHMSLPWSSATARFLGGWGSPSLVFSGNTDAIDVAVELKKDDGEGEGRGKKLKKLLLPLLIGLKLKSALFGMLSYGAVAALAGKALLVSVASLIISAVLGVRRMYQHWDTTHTIAGSSAQYSSYEPSYYHHHRSYEPAVGASETSAQHATIASYVPSVDQLAYKGYTTN